MNLRRVTEQVPEGEEGFRDVDVHDDGGRAPVSRELDGTVDVHSEAELVADFGRAGDVFDDDPVLWPVQEEVGIFRKVLDVDRGWVAARQAES